MSSSVSMSTASEIDGAISVNVTQSDSVEPNPESAAGVNQSETIEPIAESAAGDEASASSEEITVSLEQSVSDSMMLNSEEPKSDVVEILAPAVDTPSVEPEEPAINEESKSLDPTLSPSEASSAPVDTTDDSAVNTSAIDEQTDETTTPKVKKRKKFSPLDRLIIDDGKGKPKKKPKKEAELPKLKGDGDIFCWSCHKPGTSMAKCTRCSRVYHATFSCSYLVKEVPENWACYECDLINEAIETEKNLPKKFDRESLNSLLLVATDQLAKHPGAEYFINPVDDPEFSDYREYVFCPMSFFDIKEKISKNAYNNFYSFIIDLKLLIHNSYIYNTPVSEITHIARQLVRKGSTFVEEIKSCPECVVNSFEPAGFTKACTEVHLPVWAKYKLYPYWPAKVIKFIKSENETLVQVKFFGAHNRADLPLDMIYLYSEKAPSKYLSRSKNHLNNYIKSREEMKLYINNLALKFHEFKFAPLDTKLKEKSLEEQIRMMLPKYPAKRITKVAEMKLIKELNLSRKKTSVPLDVNSEERTTPNHANCQDESVNTSQPGGEGLKRKPGRPFKRKRGRWSKVIPEANASNDGDQKDDLKNTSDTEVSFSPLCIRKRKPKSSEPFSTGTVSENEEVTSDLTTSLQTSSSPVPLKEITSEDISNTDVPAKRKRGRPHLALPEIKENASKTAISGEKLTDEPNPILPDEAPAENTSETNVPVKRKRGRPFKAARPSSQKSLKDEESKKSTISKTGVLTRKLPSDAEHGRLTPKSENLESRSISPRNPSETLKLAETSVKQGNTKTEFLPQGTHKLGLDVSKSRSMSPRTALNVAKENESEVSLSDEDPTLESHGDLDDISQYIDSDRRRAVVVLERINFPLLQPEGKVKNSNSMEDLLSPNELQALQKKRSEQHKNVPSSNEMHASNSNVTKKPLVTREEFQAYQKKKNLTRIELEALQEEMGFSLEEFGEQINRNARQQKFQTAREECEEEPDSGSESDPDFLDPEKISYEDIMDLISKCKTREQAQEYTIKAYKILSTFYATTTTKLTEQCDEEMEVLDRCKDEYEQKLSRNWETKIEEINLRCNERFSIIKEMYKKRVKNTDQYRWCNVCHSIANIFCCYGTHYCSEECQAIHWNEEHFEKCHQHKITSTFNEDNEIVISVEKKDRTLEECIILSEKLKEKKREKAKKEKAGFVISSVMSLRDEFSPSTRGGLANEEFIDQPSTSRQFIDQPSTSRHFIDQPSTSGDFRNLPSTSGLARTIPSNSAIDVSEGSDSD